MKKVVSFVVALVMLVSVASIFTGCGGNDTEKQASSGENLTFTVHGYMYDAAPEKKDVYIQYQNKWSEKAMEISNATIDWIGGNLAMIMASGEYPDIILKNAFQNVDVAKYALQGVFIDMTPYINETDTPNIWKMFTEQPTTKAIATSPDGGIYALPSYRGSRGANIETFWYINDSWLQKLNLETPTNLDELYEVLKAFKTQDPNGNGKDDEIPMTFKNDGAYNYPETLLSCWGVSTKFGMYDAYLNVQDGKVNFAPMMDEWKEMIRFYSKLYSEGLLDKQCFTYDDPSWSAVMRGDTAVVGVAFGRDDLFGKNTDQYKVMLPLRAHKDSPDPLMHIHPGVIGTRNACHVTSACEDPAAALSWIDTFYDVEQTITNWYGEAEGEFASFTYNENPDYSKGEATYMWKDYEAMDFPSLTEMYNNNTTYGPHMLGYCDLEKQRGKLIQDDDTFAQYDELYAMYEPYMDLENSWPRPYYDPDDSTTLANLQTDIFNTVEMHKANWIMGRSNMEEEWDAYIEQLKKINVEQFIEINQRAYDVFRNVLTEATK